MLVTAQACCWGFWTYFLLMLREAGVSRDVGVFAVGLIVLHPVSFFLIAAYSESLFFLSLFGFIYWVERPGPAALILTGVHGFFMTVTRFVGITLIFYPLFRSPSAGIGNETIGGMSVRIGAIYRSCCCGGFGKLSRILPVEVRRLEPLCGFARSRRGIDPYPLAILDPRVFYDTVTTWNEHVISL